MGREGCGKPLLQLLNCPLLITILSIGPGFWDEEKCSVSHRFLSKNVFLSKHKDLPFLSFLVLSCWGLMDPSASIYFPSPFIPGNFSLDSIFQCYYCLISLHQSTNSLKIIVFILHLYFLIFHLPHLGPVWLSTLPLH